MTLRVGMYAHHQGLGHLQRCRAIAAALAGSGEPVEVTILSSRPEADVVLPLDVEEGRDDYPEYSAGGTLHWAPLNVPGLCDRMAAIAGWVAENRPDVFFVDVSAEVCLLVRLLGVPVVTVAMPGDRTDAPHQLAYAQASALIAGWPEEVPVPEDLAAHADRVHAVGGISRFDSPDFLATRTEPVPEFATFEARHAVVLQGQGGTSWTEDFWASVEQACPGWRFTVLGGSHRVENPLPYLAQADLVISAAGQNSVADIALAGTPAIFIPQDRAFDEQQATGAALESLGLATVLHELPAPEAWPSLLDQTLSAGADWARWQVPGAAGRAAGVLRDVARQYSYNGIGGQA